MRITSEILDRQPPQDLEAEKAVLGSVLLLPVVLDDLVMILKEQDFYSDVHATIYRHLVEMHNTSKRIDISLLTNRLKKSGDFELIGGSVYLAEIAHSVPTAANAEHYARIVHEHATARSLIRVSTETLKEAYENQGETREMLRRAEERMLSVLDDRGPVGKTVNVGEMLAESLVRLERRREGKAPMGIATGYGDLDRKLCGLHPGELIIVAARPSLGKTSLALNIAEHAAIDNGEPTLVFSLEMSAAELGERLLSARGRVNGHRMRGGNFGPDEQADLVKAAAEMSAAPLHFDDSPSLDMTQIQSIARRHKRKYGLQLVIVDYLQLITPDNTKDNREGQVARIARRLKGMARELEVPVLCVAQLNRQTESAKDNRPRLSHLRESGAIEQDADVVLFVHREEYFKTKPEEKAAVKGQAEIIVAKQRNGPCGDIKLCWFEEYSRFDNQAPQYTATNFGSDWNNR